MAERFAGSSVGMMPWCAVTGCRRSRRASAGWSSWPMIWASVGSVLSRLSRDRGHFGEYAFGQVARNRARVRRGLCVSYRAWAISRFPARPAQAAWNRLPQVPRSNSSGGPCARVRSRPTPPGHCPRRGSAARPAVRRAAAGSGHCRRCWHRRHPLRGERLTACGQRHVDGPVRHGHEGRDLSVAVHHEFERRGLHARPTARHRSRPAARAR